MTRGHRTPAHLQAACRVAVAQAGGPTKLSRKVGITSQGVSRWKMVPAWHVLAVEKASGISRHVLRPDIYGKAPQPIIPDEQENGVPA